MKKKVLITGGSGFIGSHVIEEVLKRGLQPVIFDRYAISSYPEGCEVFRGDIRDAESIQVAVGKVDYAINLAGILGTQETINDPLPSLQTNIMGCVNFLNACRPSGFNKVQAVEIGIGNYWMNNSYSITKSTAIRFCKMYNKEHKTKVAMVIGFHAYGERQKHKPVRKIIPTFIIQALKGKNIEIYGDGKQIIDMIYVKDLARILLDACIKDHGIYDEWFEAGTGRRTTVNWIATQVIKVCKSKSRIIYSPMRPGEAEHAVVVADPKTLEPLGKYEFTPFEEGIVKTVKWYKENYSEYIL